MTAQWKTVLAMTVMLLVLGTPALRAEEGAPGPADDGGSVKDGADWGPEWPMPMREMMERWGTHGRGMPGMMAGGWWPAWGSGRGMMAPDDGEGPLLSRIDGRLAFIRTELHVTDAQSAAWDKAAGAIRTAAESHNRDMRAMVAAWRDGSFDDMTLPERLAFRKAHMETRLKDLDALTAALTGLYDALDDAQKKTADEIVLPMTGMGMGYGMGGRRGMMER